MHRAAVSICLCAVAVLVAGSPTIGQQGPPSVQRFDQPLPGARSPRNANHEIAVRLDHEHRMLHGRQVTRWRNISAYDASELRFHLYWNAFRSPDSSWMRGQRLAGGARPSRPDDVGWIDVKAIRVVGDDAGRLDLTAHLRYLALDDGNVLDRTVVEAPLPFRVGPNDTIEVELEWESKIPFAFTRLRTGWIGDYYFIAQWFPKIGVLEDSGWKVRQFHRTTEFYADYGVYDVQVTVPRHFVVGASGREAGRVEHEDGTATYSYRGEDITDFAWTASPHFLERRQAFEDPALPRVEMRLLLQPEHAGQEERHFAATAAALRHLGTWAGPYQYGHLTIVDPAYQSGSQGMEYPTLFTAGSRWLVPREVSVPEHVTIHEAVHQFWYGMVSTNEVEHAWMDEGLATFSSARVVDEMGLPHRLALRFFGGFVPWVVRDIRLSRATDGNRLGGYRAAATAEVPATPAFQYWPSTATAITYDKTALWLHTLERHLGWPVLQQILATYFDRWQFRHPQPEHFFRIVNEISGQDMTWFFDQVYRSSNVFDYGVQELISDRLEPAGAAANGPSAYRTIVVARRYGEATFPVDVLTTFADGEQVRERWDGLDRRIVYVYERPARAATAQVDPERVLLLDVDYTNNSRTLTPRAAEASLKWSLKWMVWLQELMLTYGFFV